MNCSLFEELVHDLDRPGTEGFAVREAALAHAETCGKCASLLTQSESLDQALRAISREGASQQAPAKIESLLLEDFRQRNAISARSEMPWRRVAALATAAALFLALGVSLYRTRGQNQSASRTPGSGSVTAQVANEDRSPLASAQEDLLAADQALASDEATDFVPLPLADGSAADETGAIVRVTLSRSALASLGLPVTDMGATERIPADIIVSEDGAPQAIRLVSESELREE